VFGEVADLYDLRRPGYPDALYADLLAEAKPARRALEAGAGTGKATAALARRGVEVVALEPDPRMAAIARRACEGLPVEVLERRFEDGYGDPGEFDLVVSAQAWHWVDAERGLAIARRALRPRGVLATWWNHAGAWAGPMRAALDAAYLEWAPELSESVVNRWIDRAETAPSAGPGFEALPSRRYTWTERYDAAEYAELIQTHSDHRTLPPERLEGLVAAVRRAIEEVGGGELVYPYRTDLVMVRREAR
jgi:SAM-dependent methyltransferase